jgi:hypothetical protein
MFERMPAALASRRPRIVMVGAGFGGLAAKTPLPPFRYRSLREPATIRRKEAVVDLGWINLRGRVGSAPRRWDPSRGPADRTTRPISIWCGAWRSIPKTVREPEADEPASHPIRAESLVLRSGLKDTDTKLVGAADRPIPRARRHRNNSRRSIRIGAPPPTVICPVDSSPR